jgi:hypothetical protein
MSKLNTKKQFEYIVAHSVAFSMQSHLGGVSRIGSLSDDDARRHLRDARNTMERLQPTQSGKDHVRGQTTSNVQERPWEEVAIARALHTASKYLANDETGNKIMDTINEGEALAFSELLKAKFPDLISGLDEEWRDREAKRLELFDL